MITRALMAAGLAAAACLAAAAGTDPHPAPDTIVRIALSPEDDERQPFAVPAEPQDTVEIDFPWAVQDWAGRGFTPDAEKYAGDLIIEASRGSPRIFVTPVTGEAHRVLHVVLAQAEGRSRSIPLEFIPAPAGLAWRKVIFTFAGGEATGAPKVTLSDLAPSPALREPSPESEIGVLRTLRLLSNADPDGARALAAANPSLELKTLDARPRSFGDFTLTPRIALRDATTDTLALCVSVANAGGRRLLFDPASWIIRVGDRAYPVRTVDFGNELEPGATAAAFLVLARGPNGEPTRLLPDNDFEVSVKMSGSVNPRPVRRLSLKGFDPE